MSKTNNPSAYLYPLVANYRKGDDILFTKKAERYKNEHIIHSLVCGYIAIYKANKTKECKRPLEIIYDKLTCGIHRTEIIKILYDNGALSNNILREIEFDSYEETRKFYQKIMNNKDKQRTGRKQFT